MGTSVNRIIRELCRVAGNQAADRDLLGDLVARRDRHAFEELLRRHGPMVLTVCRRILRNEHDAEDAFQATFLVLIRRAVAIRKRDSVGSWLYGVAYRTARKVQVMNSRRRLKESQALARSQSQPAEGGADLDEALHALPERYRVPVVLCELEGRSRKDAARELKIPEGTLSSRLATARKMLARRLKQHGWTGAELAPAVTSLPVLLAASTAKAGAWALAGQAVAGIVSAQVIALSEGVVKAMFVNKLKALVTAVVVVGTIGVSSGPVARLAWVERTVAAAEEQPDLLDDRVKQTQAELIAAQAMLKKLEQELAEARARVAVSAQVFALARDRAAGRVQRIVPNFFPIQDRFRWRIPIELGATEFKEGCRLEITEVWGTRPRIEPGGQYIVRGKYALPPNSTGVVYLYRTAADGNDSRDLDLQHTTDVKGEGEFMVLHGMNGPGYLHVQLLAGKDQNEKVADVYFGHGENVWRK